MSTIIKTVGILSFVFCLTSNGVHAFGDEQLFAEEEASFSKADKQVSILTAALQVIILNKIPTALMQRAKAIAVIDVTKFGIGVAIGSGKGLFTFKGPVQWSNPVLVTRSSLSVGWQAGIETKTVVLVFTKPEPARKLLNSDPKLEASLELTAGPLATEVGTDAVFEKDVYSYSDGKGIFAGLSLKSLSVSVDPVANEGLYGEKVSTDDIISGKATTDSKAVTNLKGLLDSVSR